MGVRAALVMLLALAPSAQAQNVTIGTSAAYPPIIIHDGAAPIQGLEADILNALCAEAGWDCTWEILDFDTLIPALEVGRIDIAANGLGYSPSRAARVHMTCPYRISVDGLSSGRFLVRDPSITPEDGPIAVLRGSLHEDALVAQGFEVRPFLEDADALNAVVSGTVPSYYGPDAIASQFADALGLTPAGSVPIRSSGTSFGVTPTRPDLIAEVDAELAALSSRGLLTSIMTRWLGQSIEDPISRCQNDPITS